MNTARLDELAEQALNGRGLTAEEDREFVVLVAESESMRGILFGFSKTNIGISEARLAISNFLTGGAMSFTAGGDLARFYINHRDQVKNNNRLIILRAQQRDLESEIVALELKLKS